MELRGKEILGEIVKEGEGEESRSEGQHEQDKDGEGEGKEWQEQRQQRNKQEARSCCLVERRHSRGYGRWKCAGFRATL